MCADAPLPFRPRPQAAKGSAAKAYPMRFQVGPWLLGALLALSGCLAAADPGRPSPPRPFAVAVYGDSFTAAADPGHGDNPALSWATGTLPGIDSVLERLRAAHPDAVAENAAFSGARMADFPRQAAHTAAGADEVLVWLGINDLCATEPTDPGAFDAQTAAAFATIERLHPDARVVVYAVPDLWRLHEIHDAAARAFWKPIPYCQDFFDPPATPIAATLAHLRLEGLNGILRDEAAAHGFRYSEATSWPDLTLADVTAADYFHPNAAGEHRIAASAWPDADPSPPAGAPRGLLLVP